MISPDEPGMAIHRAMHIWVHTLWMWLRLAYLAIILWHGGRIVFVIEP